MVERIHHSLKASLMACCLVPDWKAQLLWVLLGLRTTPRANGDLSPAEKVYGEALTVPGEFFPADSDDPDIPLARLRAAAQKFVPCRETYTDRRKQYRLSALDSCKFVLTRNDTTLPPLTLPYRHAPHQVAHWEEVFLVSIGVHEDWVSIDLKPAVIPDEDDPAEGPCRTPPQNAALLEPSSAPRRHPRKAAEPPRSTTKDGILFPDSTDDEEMEDIPRPMSSRTRGLLQPPARFR
ncbi:uncharacterized protein LOC135224812 [Macrobrachium nipponense]|uniref:uncharacterized protein LOC135224812 n=1 Tax=Macrobrachium nipponense TaxID=159736 RepID=UPI0030C7DD52